MQASFGLAVNGCGLYLMLQASIGLAPWDVLALALSKHLPLSYGSVVMLIGFLLIGVNLLLGEPIGIGMVLDALIVGSVADLLTQLDLVPTQTALLSGVFCMLLGLTLVAVSQWIYVRGAWLRAARCAVCRARQATSPSSDRHRAVYSSRTASRCWLAARRPRGDRHAHGGLWPQRDHAGRICARALRPPRYHPRKHSAIDTGCT